MSRKVYLLLFFVINVSVAYSQCTSGSGTPIVNETFGAGPNFGPALPASVTNMQYVANTCPEDGSYTIVNSTSNCYSGIWHSLTDHTGDPNGYFMLINASYTPSDFYIDTVKSLCTGTTYEFSAWIVNMYDTDGGIEPNITFSIEKTDGTILNTHNTEDIPVTNPATWVKYGFTFTTPAGVSSVVIRMHNNAPGGDGNDLALDDIGFSPAGPTTVISAPGAKNDTLYNYCFNKTVSLAPTIGNCYVQNTYQWQSSADGTTWADIPNASNADYNFTVQNPGTQYFRLYVAEQGNITSVNCRVNSNTLTVVSKNSTSQNIPATICANQTYTLPSGKVVNIAGLYADTARSAAGCDSLITNLNLTVNDIPQPNLGPDLTICFGDTTTLTPGTFSSYVWQDKSTLPYYKASKAGRYIVKVYNENGCEASDTLQLHLTNCSPIKIPNTFSPNGDGINDTWNIPQLTIYNDITEQIFNRYGQIVFNTKGQYIAWDGKVNGNQAPVGTYYYIINVPDIKQKFSGWLLLVR